MRCRNPFFNWLTARIPFHESSKFGKAKGINAVTFCQRSEGSCTHTAKLENRHIFRKELFTHSSRWTYSVRLWNPWKSQEFIGTFMKVRTTEWQMEKPTACINSQCVWERKRVWEKEISCTWLTKNQCENAKEKRRNVHWSLTQTSRSGSDQFDEKHQNMNMYLIWS